MPFESLTPIVSDLGRPNDLPSVPEKNSFQTPEINPDTHFQERKDGNTIEDENLEMMEFVVERYPNAFEEVTLEDDSTFAIIKDIDTKAEEFGIESQIPQERIKNPLPGYLVAFSKYGFTIIHKEYAKVFHQPTSLNELRAEVDLKTLSQIVSQAPEVISGRNPVSKISFASKEEGCEYVFGTYKKGITVEDIKKWSPYFDYLDKVNKQSKDLKGEIEMSPEAKIKFFK